jgi:membrane protein implicated in regulation of membrane protease activity
VSSLTGETHGDPGGARPRRQTDVTTTFLIVGAFGLLLLALSVLGGGHLHIGHAHLHVHLPDFHGHGHVGHPAAEAALSTPSIAGFIGAFGFGGAITAQVTDAQSAGVPAIVGLVAAFPTAWLAARLTRAAMEMHTDATPEQSDVIGSIGVVIRAIPGDGYGEVRVSFAGQHMKYHARATQPLSAGAQIIVIDAPSTTSVIVEPITSFLS